MKVLFAADGSQSSDHAAQFLVKSLRPRVKNLKVTLFHVDQPMLKRVVAALGQERVAQIHRENSELALKGARHRLERAKIAFDEAHMAGTPAACISRKATHGKYDLVLMGSRGHTALKGALLGSVTARVLSESKIPVLVVR
ncbi:MAG: universal stress protein [Proteobacteria bacterium]|nr:universal stress protein [Pseudomonadota bacterium]